MPASATSKPARVLYWFRTDLRLHDSPALAAALALSPAALFPVFTFDPSYIYAHRVGVNRFRFLLESMSDLSARIKEVNDTSQLLVVRGEPSSLLPELWKRWSITHIAFESDPNGYARSRDQKIRDLAKENKVQVVETFGHQLYDVEAILRKNGGKPTMTMASLQKVVSSFGSPAKPIEAPASLPSPLPPSDESLSPEQSDVLRSLHSLLDGLPHYSDTPAIDLNSASIGGQRHPGAKGTVTCYETVAGNSKGDPYLFDVPTLASLGMSATDESAPCGSPIRGGESAALARLKNVMNDVKYVATFAKPKTSPASTTDEPSTTLLSPYLKFGCLSVRRLWWDVDDACRKYKGSKSDIPENLHGQLLFRDMYAVAEAAVGDSFKGVRGNKISRYMDWYLPNQYDSSGHEIIPRPRGDEVSETRLEAYKTGKTGFPWIDALMRQLRATGWIHHLGRHSLASFLTRGQCWISWERGAEIFDEYLIDWDPASNPGNWMWLSCSAFYSQYFRVYGLSTFPAKSDKSGVFVRRWCPELANIPDKYVYAPHTAPLAVQRKAGCIIGKDYPAPMLDEKEEKERCIARCKAAFQLGLHGADPSVMDGSAEQKLRELHGQPHPAPMPKNRDGNKIPDWAKASAERNTGVASGSKPVKKTEKAGNDKEVPDNRESLQGGTSHKAGGKESGMEAKRQEQEDVEEVQQSSGPAVASKKRAAVERDDLGKGRKRRA